MKSPLRIAVFLILIFFNHFAFAIDYKIIGPCSDIPAYSGTIEVSDLFQTVGKTTLQIFEQRQIPFIGNDYGFNSIMNTPTDKKSIEILSATKMRAYGWCYSVNGVIPEILPGNAVFISNQDQLSWFYAYSTYDTGKWLDYCVPSYTIKADQFCPNQNR